jgi:hypothetical protein
MIALRILGVWHRRGRDGGKFPGARAVAAGQKFLGGCPYATPRLPSKGLEAELNFLSTIFK